MKTAQFTVTNSETNEVIAKYELDYETLEGLKADFLESRQVWSEYMVIVDADDFQLTSPYTWRNEFLLSDI